MEKTAIIEQRLNAALARWQLWPDHLGLQEAPAVISRLLADVPTQSNSSFLVSGGDDLWVARIQSATIAALALDPRVEWQAQQQAYHAGIAPEPLVLDLEHGLLVSRYMVTDAGDKADSVESVANLLHAVHALPGIEHALDSTDLATHYRSLTGNTFIAVIRELNGLQPMLASLRAEAAALCSTLKLCHNDLLSANRLPTRNGLLALDWEYAAMGDPAFDLAAICAGDELDTTARANLIDAYAPEDTNMTRRVSVNLILYRELELAWSMATENISHDSAVCALAALLDLMDDL